MTIDLIGINQRNFDEKVDRLQEKIIWLLESRRMDNVMTSSLSDEVVLKGKTMEFTKQILLKIFEEFNSSSRCINTTDLKIYTKPLKQH